MPIPVFFQFIRPTLELFGDGCSRHASEVEKELANKFDLTEAERNELIPSGIRTRVRDRVEWAITYLRQAKLIESVKPGISVITKRGCQYIETGPQLITQKDLTIFPEFMAFLNKNKNLSDKTAVLPIQEVISTETHSETLTPQDALDEAFNEINNALALEILERVKKMSPTFFERLIVQLMLKLGYGGSFDGAGEVIGKSGDEGIDGVISQDKLGLDKIYLQAKRYTDKNIVPEQIHAFIGALINKGASKGVFITTSDFTSQAIKAAGHNPNIKISLIKGTELAKLMIQNDLGVSLVRRYDVKRLDSDMFSE